MVINHIEKWLPVEGYEGFYLVSDLGNVRSLHTGKVLKRTAKGRYPGVNLYRDGNGKATGHYLHHLAAAAFIGPRPRGMDICHINGDREDARADNLRYDTRNANMRDSLTHGTHRSVGQTHCKNGHEYAVDGFYTRHRISADGAPKTNRVCKPCLIAAVNAYRARKRAA